MPKDPFVVLGLPKTATQSEIFERYTELRNKYSDERFLDGEAGADAARKLSELYDAYNQAMEYVSGSATIDDDADRGVPKYSDVEDALKRKDFKEAQRLLDDVSLRDAEWHYLQAAVFFNNNWLNESKRQLEIALEMEPMNQKYKSALEKLKQNINGGRPFNQGQQNQYGGQPNQQGYYQDNPNNRSYQQQQQQGADPMDSCCAMCTACMCADCLCRMC